VDWSHVLNLAAPIAIAILVLYSIDKSIKQLQTSIRRLAVDYKRWADQDNLIERELKRLRAEQEGLGGIRELEWWKVERVIHKARQERTRSTHAFVSGDEHYGENNRAKDSYELTIDEQIAELSKAAK
jgi:predicted Holliday junction resolvase-like endonuclease